MTYQKLSQIMKIYCPNFTFCPGCSNGIHTSPENVPVNALNTMISNKRLVLERIINLDLPDKTILIILYTYHDFLSEDTKRLQKLWEILIKKHPNHFKYVPKRYQSQSMCHTIAIYNPYSLKYMENSHITAVMRAIEIYPELLSNEMTQHWIYDHFREAFLSGLDHSSLPEFFRNLTQELWDRLEYNFEDLEYDIDDMYVDDISNLYQVLKFTKFIM